MNLSELIPIERSLILLDTETTGQNPSQDRIVQIGFVQIKPDGTIREWETYVNPGIPIPVIATRGNGENYPGHGITDDMVAKAPSFLDLAPHLLRGFKDCDYGGYNLKSYDLPLLRAEFERVGTPWNYSGARILDGYRLWQLGSKRTLSDAVEHFLGRSHEGAHGAVVDARASLHVIIEQLQRFQTLPKTLDQLHALQWPRDPNAVDEEGKFIWKHGVVVCNFGKKWKDQPLHKIDKGYLKWMLDGNFLADTKHIVSEALEGRLPKKEISDDPGV